jgi:hypothetical protein
MQTEATKPQNTRSFPTSEHKLHGQKHFSFVFPLCVDKMLPEAQRLGMTYVLLFNSLSIEFPWPTKNSYESTKISSSSQAECNH